MAILHPMRPPKAVLNWIVFVRHQCPVLTADKLNELDKDQNFSAFTNDCTVYSSKKKRKWQHVCSHTFCALDQLSDTNKETLRICRDAAALSKQRWSADSAVLKTYQNHVKHFTKTLPGFRSSWKVTLVVSTFWNTDQNFEISHGPDTIRPALC